MSKMKLPEGKRTPGVTELRPIHRKIERPKLAPAMWGN